MLILGIETSCDETAASLVETEDGRVSILSNTVSSQIALHAKWGGVVPNLAAREHLKNILPIIEETFKSAGKSPQDLDLISVTNGPGLIPALLIGTSTAKALSYLWKKPLIGIHHIEGHIYANCIPSKKESATSLSQNKQIEFPLLCLVVSGGHTQLVLMKEHLHYEIVGETLDDAVGEAFDKVARILGLAYPGGPLVEKQAASIPDCENKFQITLPRPMLKSGDLNFSFSGIKTAVLYAVKKNQDKLTDPRFVAEMCREFQNAVTDVLIDKTLRAAKIYNPKTITLAGGVSANQALRKVMGLSIEKSLSGTTYLVPELTYSLDNAAMIACAGYFRWKESIDKALLNDSWRTLTTDPNLRLNS